MGTYSGVGDSLRVGIIRGWGLSEGGGLFEGEAYSNVEAYLSEII